MDIRDFQSISYRPLLYRFLSPDISVFPDNKFLSFGHRLPQGARCCSCTFLLIMQVSANEAAMLELIRIIMDDDYGFCLLLVEMHLAATLRERMPVPSGRFQLAKLPSNTCVLRYRFSRPQILLLHRALQLPDIIYSSQRVPIPSVEALCIVLRRLSYPCRWFEFVEEFFHDEAVLSTCFTETIDLLYQRCAEKLTFDAPMIAHNVEIAARCVHDRIQELTAISSTDWTGALDSLMALWWICADQRSTRSSAIMDITSPMASSSNPLSLQMDCASRCMDRLRVAAMMLACCGVV